MKKTSGSLFSSWLIIFSSCIVQACVVDAAEQTNLVFGAGLSNTLEFVYVQGGDFPMGRRPKRPEPWTEVHFDSAKPEHKVLVSFFWMGKYPVSVAQYCEYLNKSRSARRPENSAGFFRGFELRNGNYAPIATKSLHPIVVSFSEAKAYCAWLSEITGKKCQLPTEAQWEELNQRRINRC